MQMQTPVVTEPGSGEALRRTSTAGSPAFGAALAVRSDEPPSHLELVRKYSVLVRRIAAQVHRRAPASVQRDDLVAAGMSGLWDAVRRRGSLQDENFDFYVCTRVRGAIIDELRTEDWLPRRRPGVEQGTRSQASIVYFEDLGGREHRRASGEGLLDGEHEVETRIALERVMHGLARLPARERYVLLMRDVEGVPIKDLGEELGVSRPRICQLRTQALRRLREYLEPVAA